MGAVHLDEFDPNGLLLPELDKPIGAARYEEITIGRLQGVLRLSNPSQYIHATVHATVHA